MNKCEHKRAITFSVVLTTWNMSDCIEEMLTSLKEQSFPPDEVLIFDDGSSDGTKEIVETFCRNNESWHFYGMVHQGVSSLRNIGIEKIWTDYFFVLDGDDILSRDYFESFYPVLLQNPDVGICGSYELDHKSGFINKIGWSNRPQKNPGDKDSIFYSYMGWAWDKAFKTQFIKDNKLLFPHLRNSEDLVFVYSSLILARKILHTGKCSIYHRVNRLSSLSNSLTEEEQDYYKAVQLMKIFLKERYVNVNQGFEEWAADFLLWAVKGGDYRFDDLLKTFSEVPWEEIAQRKPRYYSGLNWIMKAKKNNPSKTVWNLIYLFYRLKKFGIGRAKRIISSYFIELINNFPKN